MKLKKIETAALAATVIFASVTGGYLLGRAQPAGVMPGSSPIVVTERADIAESSSAPTDVLPALPEPGTPVSAPDTPRESASVASYNRININTASHAELTDLSGIGDALAGRIIEYREQNGAFAAIEDIMNVSGIGEKKFASIRDYITVG